MTFYEMIEQYYGKDSVKNIKEALTYKPVYALRANELKQFDAGFDADISFLNPKLEIPLDYAQAVTHPFNHAGAYYLQDPSASLAVEFMNLQDDDVVLDLCAAPGGKSTEILNQIPSGFLIANELNPKRNQRLQFNLNRWGQEQVVVTQMTGDALAKQLPNRFNKVLVDAPCSAEGLVRRQPELIDTYNIDNAYEYQVIQKELLANAYECVCNGGQILYATCTLNPIENEAVVQWFLDTYPGSKLLDLEHPLKTPGIHGLDQAAHFFPSVHGEGHFMALISCEKESDILPLKFEKFKLENREIDGIKFNLNFKQMGEEVFALSNRGYLNEDLKITMDGIPLALKKTKNHVWRHAASQYPNIAKSFLVTELDLKEAYQYLYGIAIEKDVKGLTLVSFEGAVLGFAKGSQGKLNNQYPKAFRNRFETYD